MNSSTKLSLHIVKHIVVEQSQLAQIWEPLLPPFLFGTVRVQDFLAIGGWKKFEFVRVLNFSASEG